MKDIHGVPYGERKFPSDPANMKHNGRPLEEIFLGAVVEKKGRLTVQHTRQMDGSQHTWINAVNHLPAHERFTECGHE